MLFFQEETTDNFSTLELFARVSFNFYSKFLYCADIEGKIKPHVVPGDCGN
jgi:hypothetical protein